MGTVRLNRHKTSWKARSWWITSVPYNKFITNESFFSVWLNLSFPIEIEINCIKLFFIRVLACCDVGKVVNIGYGCCCTTTLNCYSKFDVIVNWQCTGTNASLDPYEHTWTRKHLNSYFVSFIYVHMHISIYACVCM